MKVRFIIVFIVSMVAILVSTIIFTYSSVLKINRDMQTEFIEPLKDISGDDPDILRHITVYEAFGEKRAVESTRNYVSLFLVLLLIMIALFMLFILGITRPIKKLSVKVDKAFLRDTKENFNFKEQGSAEVRTLICAFNKAFSRITQYEELVGDISRFRGWKEISRLIVHEVNNILSPARVYCEYLVEKSQNEDKAMMILKKIDEISGVLSKFREISHLPEANLKKTDIVPVICEVCKEFDNVVFMSEYEEMTLPIDTILFKEIIRNLIKNAVESGDSVNVTVRLLLENQNSVVSVEDNGCGISRNKLDSIFNPGFSTKSGNLGIGLSLVKSLIYEHNGNIEVESNPGKWTKFRVIIPAYKE